MKRLAALLADWSVRRPAWILLVGAIFLVGSSAFLALRQNFDTDILNLLPAGRPEVEGLKLYNRAFTQTRELAFLLHWEHPPEDADRYVEEFDDLLRAQPWVVRLLDQAPMNGGDPSPEIAPIAASLLLNLPPEKFQAALAALRPDQIAARLGPLADEALAGSPKARFTLESDPLGLVGLAVQPVWETMSFSETFDLTTDDGSATLVPVVTNQADPSANACSATMRQVRAFIAEAKRKLGPGGPEIGVTGRSPYVEEISGSMQRDIALTSTVSLLSVIALFWVGFRRILPLVGITLILAMTAVLSMVCGVAVFQQLNVIAISFCSILFGLGDDFSLLLCQHFYQARLEGRDRRAAIAEAIEHCLPGMLWVALTTGVGFLFLCLSGSSGFAQLGFLVATGLFLCALLMPVFLFPFLGEAPAPRQAAATGPARWFAQACLHRPRGLLIAGVAAGLLAGAALFLPGQPLRFDISPASLEPKSTPAAQTLALMLEKFPATFEPVMVVLPHPTPAQFQALNATLRKLQAEGRITSYSSPSGLFLLPDRQRANQPALRAIDWEAVRRAVHDAGAAHGLRDLPQATAQIDALRRVAGAPVPPRWDAILPPGSTWWFLVDRMLSPSSDAVIAYLRTPKTVTAAERAALAREIGAAVPDAMVTGWSQALAELVPWAQRELLVFGSAVGVIVLAILAFVYRDLRLWSIHLVSIVAALAATAATLQWLHLPVNLLNVLAVPLMIGVGVDYGTHLILAARQSDVNLAGTIKAVALSGCTTGTGFGALVLAQNPALAGLGAICGIGVMWCLFFSLLIVAPGTAAIVGLQEGARRDTH